MVTEKSNIEIKKRKKEFDKESWNPKTILGKKVKSGEITSIEQVFQNVGNILEPEIVDALLPNLKEENLLIGQSKGKFGGGKRIVWRSTQKKSMDGNKPSFSVMTIVGSDNYIGIGMGKAKETMPAKEKATKKAKLNLIKIQRGCGNWECNCNEPHSIPFAITGKVGSSQIKLMPAPKGTGLRAQKECCKILDMAGIKDIYSKTKGQTSTRVNLLYACFEALKNLTKTKV